ncbi:hypothetical protein SBA3_2760048 [Candidatus Sulfopaludibacter sp. SbA3]|nr:hypothetical protein SBA3_2760048 [Candidatus Sulfopaludibacter sp. SbA3]
MVTDALERYIAKAQISLCPAIKTFTGWGSTGTCRSSRSQTCWTSFRGKGWRRPGP